MMARSCLAQCALLLLGTCLLASAAPGTKPAIACKVCVTANIRNVTSQGALTAASCSAFVKGAVNTNFLAKLSTTDTIQYTCANDDTKGGVTIKACSPVPDVNGARDAFASITNGAADLYNKLLQSVCPATADDLDYLQLIVSLTGSACPVVPEQPLGFRYCRELRDSTNSQAKRATALNRPRSFTSNTASSAGSNDDVSVKNSPPGQGYCKICLTYQSYTAFDAQALYQQLSADLTVGAPGLNLWSYMYQPTDRQIAYWLDQSYPYAPYSLTVCTSSTYFWFSPSTNINYQFTSDYLVQVVRDNDYFTSKYNLGCKTNTNPAYGNLLYWSTAPYDMLKYGGIYPVQDAAGTHYCAPPAPYGAGSDNTFNYLGKAC